MTKDEARSLLKVHAGSNEACFDQGYCFKLRYGIKSEEEIEKLFDEIFACLKCLKDSFYKENISRDLLADIQSIQAQSIIYSSKRNLWRTYWHIYRSIIRNIGILA